MTKAKTKINQVDRVLILLKILSDGQSVCLTKDLAILNTMNHYNNSSQNIEVGLRSLQKDITYLKEYLKDNLTKEGNCYKLLKEEQLSDFFHDNHQELRNFFHAISLIDATVFGKNFAKYKPLLKSIKSEQKGVYLFLENPFENLKQLKIKKQLETYIQERNYINIHYHANKTNQIHQYRRVQPFKIIYMNGNWYLAVITTQDHEVNGGFKLLRLNFVKKITRCRFPPLNFHEDREVKNFLERKFQSLFSSFSQAYFKVILEADESASRYFKVKKHLKSQEIITDTENTIRVQFTINDEMEIIPLIQRWIPHVQVIEPQWLKEKILNNLKIYQEK